MQTQQNKHINILRTILTAAMLSIALSGCGGLFSKKPKPIAQLFQRIKITKQESYKALIPAVQQSHTWQDTIDIVKLSNLKVAGTLQEWKASKLFESNNEIVAAPVISCTNTFILTKSGHVKSYRNKDKQLDWSYDLGFKLKNTTSYSSTLMQKAEKLYVLINQHFIVLSAKDGSELCYKKLSNRITSGVCVNENIAYLNDASNLYAIDVSSSRILYNAPGISTPIVIGSKIQPAFYKSNMLISNHFYGQLTFVDPKQMGKPVLQIPQPFGKAGPINIFMPSLINQPIIDNSYLYLSNHTGIVQKYDVTKERVIWSKNVHSLQKLSHIGNTLFAITLARQAVALNALNGEIAWVTNLDLNAKIMHEFLPPLCINGNLVLLSKTGNLIILNPNDGQVLFSKDLKLKNVISMAVVNDRLSIFESGQMLESH